MSTLRISDAPLLPDVDGTEKIPTGGRGDYAVSVDQIKTFVQGGLPQQFDDHINDTNNPHQVTKDQVGLGNVDNTSDLNKPISTATQEALDLKADSTYVDEALSNLSTQASKFYPTLAQANADIANIEVNQPVQVGESGVNGGLWYKDTAEATSLTKSAYDPLIQAKNYTDQRFTLFDSGYFSDAGFISNTGVFTPHSGYRSTDYLKVIGGQKVLVSTIMAESRPAIVFFDADKVFISYDGVNQTTLSTVEYTVPINARFMRVVGRTQYTNVSNFNIKSALYDIDKVRQIIESHNPIIDSSSVKYGSESVSQALNSIIANQGVIIAGQNSISNQLDLMTDADQPFFINIPEFVKSSITPTNYSTVTVTARNSDRVLTVSDITAFAVGSACTIYDSTADTYTSHVVVSINGNQVTFANNVPNNPVSIQTMHDATNGQHLNPYGYRGLADYIIEQVQRYSYRKKENLLFDFHPYKHKTILWSNPNLYDYETGTEKLIDVTTSGVTFGGFVAGTTNLARTCGTARQGVNTYANTQFFGIAYELKQATQGASIAMTSQCDGKSGFVHIPISCEARPYISSIDSSNQITTGRVRLRVLNGTTEIHNNIYDIGMVHHVYVDFSNAQTLTIEMSLADAVPTVALLHGVYVYRKASTTSRDKFFEDGDVIAFHGDSWTQYPIASTVGESGQVRPDGSTSTGAQYLSRRMKDKLASQGINVTTLNMGFGGQTSEWGKYWIQSILNLTPKPTHVVICFSINDYNSQTQSTGFDFSPTNQWQNISVADGGVNGRVLTVEKWLNNIKWMCDKFIAAGIKPIVILPPQTASFSKTDGMRSGMLQTIIEGF